MPEASSNSVEATFLDRDAVIGELRRAAAGAKEQFSEIARVLLFGSLVRGNWTADSDADLMVVVRREFAGILDRSPYQIFLRAIPTDTLVYSEAEFEQLSRDPTSFVAQALAEAIEL